MALSLRKMLSGFRGVSCLLLRGEESILGMTLLVAGKGPSPSASSRGHTVPVETQCVTCMFPNQVELPCRLN